MHVDTKTMTTQVRLRHWAGVMQERSASGLSVRAWCQENGVREKTYHYWQRKLRAAACEQLAENQVPDGLMVRQPGFAEVRVAEPTLPKLPGQLCVEIGGMRLITDSSYPTDKLAMLLGELSRPC